MAAESNCDPDKNPDNTWAQMRFYAELNRFLARCQRQKTFRHSFCKELGIQQVVEDLGVPADQIDLILVNGVAVRFDHLLAPGDRVSVYPVFEAFDITGVSALRKSPLRQTRFILDVHLGKLARLLRMLGFDALYRNDFADWQLIALSRRQKRIILTRDKALLQHRAVSHGYGIRQTDPFKQICEVLKRFQLEGSVLPFSRCLECNACLEPIGKEAVSSRISAFTHENYDEFSRCPDCHRIYWKGSHHERMQRQLQAILKGLQDEGD